MWLVGQQETAVSEPDQNITITQEETKQADIEFYEHANRYIIRLEDGNEPTASQEFLESAQGVAKMCANASGQKAYVIDSETGQQVHMVKPDPKLQLNGH